jgi:hypothetical protein
MEPTEDGSRNNVLGWNTSHGRQPTRADRWRHAKTSMGSAMVVANVLFENTLGLRQDKNGQLGNTACPCPPLPMRRPSAST